MPSNSQLVTKMFRLGIRTGGNIGERYQQALIGSNLTPQQRSVAAVKFFGKLPWIVLPATTQGN